MRGSRGSAGNTACDSNHSFQIPHSPAVYRCKSPRTSYPRDVQLANLCWAAIRHHTLGNQRGAPGFHRHHSHKGCVSLYFKNKTAMRALHHANVEAVQRLCCALPLLSSLLSLPPRSLKGLKGNAIGLIPLHCTWPNCYADDFCARSIRIIMFPGQITNNYINGGRGGAGGEGYGSGTGGSGDHGMGPTLNFDIRSTGNFTMNNVQPGERGIDILHREVALAAIHDSAESYPQPRCHPETRTKMNEDLCNWAMGPHPNTAILWLFGPAGAGKSAIMQALAKQLSETGVLGGSFFFKRGHATRGNGMTLFATIAYQLALAVPSLRSPISQVVEKDQSLIRRNIETQMTKLISEPCSYQSCHHVTILIDGLDECEDHGVQREILRVIQITRSKFLTPLRFIVASRPEPHIREMFNSPIYVGHYRSYNVEQSFEDVRKYLREEFSRIHREHYTMTRVQLPWPSLDIREQLVRNSSGHFIYAATIIKFIDDKSYRPDRRLEIVLDGGQGSELAFGGLDQLYIAILKSAPRRAELIPILCAITNFDLSVGEIDQLFDLADGEAELLLRGLHSVLHIPSKYPTRGSQSEQFSLDSETIQNRTSIIDGESPFLWRRNHRIKYRTQNRFRTETRIDAESSAPTSLTISTHHASFLDFLDNQNRSHNFYVGSLDHRMNLARCFLRFCARSYQPGWINFDGPRRPHNRLVLFLTSLPPSTELCLLIARMEPDYIWAQNSSHFGLMLSWLRKIPSVTQDLIDLWQDYVYMSDRTPGFGQMILSRTRECLRESPMSDIPYSVQQRRVLWV
ncbi:hypothetical protein C8R45DRAFT_875193 [Mycena sanguinolenta]|nr:hypothetical protein C8R45DRAFT_875193 [Mycena sanguinolenta]